MKDISYNISLYLFIILIEISNLTLSLYDILENYEKQTLILIYFRKIL